MQHTFQYTPRAYQLPLLQYLFPNPRGKRAVVVWHRRAGKDVTLLNALITAALYDRVGVYYYLFPTYAQGKRIIWDGIDGNGRKFLSYIPEAAIAIGRDGKPKMNETELKIELVNGSIIQIIGTDRFDNIRGTNPVGCVVSEYQDQNPRAWETIEPILGENGGWAAFAYTPKGHNHGWTLYDAAGKEKGWFRELLTIDDTKREDGKPVISLDYIESLRRRGVDEDFIQQEYWCSFDGSMQGSYYGKLIANAYSEGRIRVVPWEPQIPVETWWDLGRNDSNVIWFSQVVGRERRFIDYYENTGQGLPHYVKVIREKEYVYEAHIMPHDINVTEYSSNVKRIDTARALGLTHIKVAPKLHINEGIDAVRRILPRCVFDAKKCERGIIALQEYHKEWDEETKSFSDTPVHDWSSNAADAFRTGAVTDRSGNPPSTQTVADSGYSIFSGPIQEVADSEYSVYGV